MGCPISSQSCLTRPVNKIEEETLEEVLQEGNPVEKHEQFLLKRKNTERDEFPKQPSIIKDDEDLLEPEKPNGLESN